jgi:glutaredoxin
VVDRSVIAEGLALYHYEGCGYCSRVRRQLTRLGVEVELRDIDEEPRFEEELYQARGRRTVPVLRIEEEGGVRWLGESRDILAYLERRFSGGQ